MSNIYLPFQTPIYQSYIEKNSFSQIKKDVKSFIHNNNNLFSSIWDCPTLTTQNIVLEKNIKSKLLEEEIKNHVKEYYNFWKFNKPCSLNIEQLWVNISNQGSYQEIHDHGNYLFSGSIYIKVNDKSGNLVLYNSLSAENILMHCSSIFDKTCSINPKNSMIVLFPGWMKHRVSQNKSDLNRISVSFNIKANFK